MAFTVRGPGKQDSQNDKVDSDDEENLGILGNEAQDPTATAAISKASSTMACIMMLVA